MLCITIFITVRLCKFCVLSCTVAVNEKLDHACLKPLCVFLSVYRYGYLPIRRVSPSFGRYQLILLGMEQKHMCEQLVSKFVTRQRNGRELNLGPLGLTP